MSKKVRRYGLELRRDGRYVTVSWVEVSRIYAARVHPGFVSLSEIAATTGLKTQSVDYRCRKLGVFIVRFTGDQRAYVASSDVARVSRPGRTPRGVRPDGDAKVCTRCGERKPLTGFYRNTQGTIGVASHCKACHLVLTTRWRANNLEKSREIVRRSTRRYAEKRRALAEGSGAGATVRAPHTSINGPRS